ncbi:MAG: excinuclease ABC subunit UvrB [Proteobacteria bacterium]|nr:excinuclease ABC subunit UvrB [Pseudomonadota bacterium]
MNRSSSAPLFRLVSPFGPTGDQPRAIAELVGGLERGDRQQVLLGTTGSGKTFTVANVVAALGRPTLVIAHNKTLAAQLYGEFRQLFPEHAVHYFVSYYDYYQPEAYVPSSDTYIEKDAIINDEIDRLRHAATQAVLSRRDVVIVASVSCIFGIGSQDFYRGMAVDVHQGQRIERDDLLRALVEIQYQRNDYDFHRGTFRVRGDVVEVFPPHEEERAWRIAFFGDEVEGLWDVDPLRGRVLEARQRVAIFPASHYVTPVDQLRRAISTVRDELQLRLTELRAELRLVEAQRLEQRTLFDLEMLEQMGYCNGIENYSRHLSGRQPGEPAPTLLDYFPRDFLLIVDESHQTVPQLQAMYRGDRSRKQTLVEHGFRLPSALDNRPLKFEELADHINQVIFVSATPGAWEVQQTQGVVVEQIIRPTGLLDPEVLVRPVTHQVDDLVQEIHARIAQGERVLAAVLTKRMAEDLTEYLQDAGIAARYLHSDIDTLERVEILRDLRAGAFSVLVGINLLREGLDLPEVSLVAILDADKEGFLRADRALIQTMGRAARNVHGTVIMYADRITPSMRRAIDETERRREVQAAYNATHGIVPRTISRPIFELQFSSIGGDAAAAKEGAAAADDGLALAAIPGRLGELRRAMAEAARALEFEAAAALRDRIHALTTRELLLRDPQSGAGSGASSGAALRSQGGAVASPRPARSRGSERGGGAKERRTTRSRSATKRG